MMAHQNEETSQNMSSLFAAPSEQMVSCGESSAFANPRSATCPKVEQNIDENLEWTRQHVDIQSSNARSHRPLTEYAKMGPDEEERVEYLKYWKRRWYHHKMAPPMHMEEDEFVEQDTTLGDFYFDWERFVINHDLVIKFEGKKIFRRKPRSLNTMNIRGSTVIAPFQTWFWGRHENAHEDELMHESYSLTKYDKRTHYRFKMCEFEGALAITRRIWHPRILGLKTGKRKWELIYQICYDFLSAKQTWENGKLKELQQSFNQPQETLMQVAEVTKQLEEKALDIKHMVDLGVVEAKEAVETVDASPIFSEAKTEVIRVDAVLEKQIEEHVDTNEEIITQQHVEVIEQKKPRRERKINVRHKIVEIRSQAEVTFFDEFKRLSRMRTNLDDTFCYFTNLKDVYFRIGRPDLAFKIGMPAKFNWYWTKGYHARAFEFLPKIQYEAQSGREEEVHNSAVCRREKVRIEMVKMLSNIYPALLRHADKMEVLCHIGKYSYLTRWDMALFERQRQTLRRIKAQIQVMLIGDDIDVVPVPHLMYYSLQARSAKESVAKAINLNEYHRALSAISEVYWMCKDWEENDFDPDRCICKVYMAQSATETPKEGLKSTAPKNDAVTAPVAGNNIVTKGKKEVTLINVDERQSDTDTVKDLKGNVSKKATTPEAFYTLLEVCKRPMFIDRVTWGTEARGKNLRSYMLPNMYFDSVSSTKTICQNLNASYVLSMFGAVKFDMKVRVQLNTTKFQQGKILACFVPFFMSDRMEELSNNLIQYPHIFLDAADSNPGELFIPWTHFRNAFPIYTDPHAEYNYFGTFEILVWNALQTGGTTSKDATISVWAWLENVEPYQLCNPKSPAQVIFATGVMKGKEDIVSADEPKEALIHTPMPKIPAMTVYEAQSLMESIIETGASVAVDTGAKLIEGFLEKHQLGKNCKANIFNPPLPVKPEVMACTAHGEGVDLSTRLSLKPLSAKKPNAEQTREVNITEDIKMWSRIGSVKWTKDDTENKTIAVAMVTPMAQIDRPTVFERVVHYTGGQTSDDVCHAAGDSGKITLVKFLPSRLAYHSLAWFFFRGGLKGKFEVVGTNMISGRLLIRYEPFGSKDSAKDECQKIATPGVIWDIQENHVLEMDFPYMSVQPYLHTRYVPGDDIDAGKLDVALGMVEISVINRLKVTTGVADNVEINLYLAAGDDFKFAVPAPLDMIHSLRTSVQAPKPKESDHSDFAKRKTQAKMDHLDYVIMRKPDGYDKKRDGKLLLDELFYWVRRRGGDKSTSIAQHQLKIIDVYNNTTRDKQFIVRPMSFEQAKQFVDNLLLQGFLPSRIQKLQNKSTIGPEELNKWSIWAAHLLSKFQAPLLPPADSPVFEEVGTEARYEAQSKSSGPTTINPFNNFIPPPPERDLLGEDFMDMYTVMKRPNLWAHMTIPPFNESNDRGKDADKRHNLWMKQDAALMSDNELKEYVYEIRIPVTPMLPFDNVGAAKHYFVFDENQGKETAFYSYRPPFYKGRGNVSSRMALTKSRFYGELATFWSGSQRFKFWFTDTTNVKDDWWALITYHPQTFTDPVREHKFDIVGKDIMRAWAAMGTVLYTGNVMATIDVEVPFYSRYDKLYASAYTFKEFTTAGTLIIYVPIVRTKLGPCDATKIVDQTEFASIGMEIWHSVGEDFRYSVPRAAPPFNMHMDYFVRNPSDNYYDEGWVTVKDSWGFTVQNKIPLDSVGQVRKEVPATTVDKNPVKSILKYMKPTKPIALEKDAELFSKDFLQQLFIGSPSLSQGRFEELQTAYKNTKNKILDNKTAIHRDKSKAELEKEKEKEKKYQAQGGDEQASSSKEIAPDEVDGILTDCLTALKQMPSTMKDFSDTLTIVKDSLNEFKTSSKVVSDTIASVREQVETTGQEVKVTSTLLGNAATWALDIGRLSLFFKGVKDLFSASSWSDRMTSLTLCAVSLGLSAEVVTKAGNWLLSWVTSLGSPQENKKLEAQGYEEEWDGSWSAFIEQHISVLRLIAAGIGTILVFYLTDKTPVTNKVNSFTGTMITKLRNFTIVGSAIKTFDWLFKWIADCVKSAIVMLGDFVTGGSITAYRMSAHYPEVISWLRRVEMYNMNNVNNQLNWDLEARDELWKTMDDGEALLSKLGVKGGHLYATIMRGIQTLNKAQARSLDAQSIATFRQDPFHLCLEGKPGAGKSAILKFILDYVCDRAEYPKKNRFYNRADEDDYWTGYCGQTCVIIDDIYANDKSPAINELIKMKSNLAWQLNMASIEEKGRAFTSKLIGSTTNTAYPQPPGVTCHKALWRRRNMLVRVRNVKTVNKDGIDWQRDLRFDILNPTKSVENQNVIVSNMKLSELMVMVAEKYAEYAKAQSALVFAGMSGKEIYAAIPEEVTKPIETHFDIFLRMIDTGLPIKSELLESYLVGLTSEQAFEIEKRVQKLEKIPKFMELYQKYKVALEIKQLMLMFACPSNCDLETARQLFEKYKGSFACVSTVREGEKVTSVFKPPDGVSGVLVCTEENGEKAVIFRDKYEAQVLDEIHGWHCLNETHDIRASLQRDAEERVRVREQLSEVYERINVDVSAPKKKIVIADENEISNFITTWYPSVEGEKRKQLEKQLKNAWNAVKNDGNSKINKIFAEFYSKLFEPAQLKRWKKNGNDWYYEIDEKDEDTSEDTFELEVIYETLKEQEKQEKINEMLELCKPTEQTVIGKVTGNIIEKLNSLKKKATQWVEDHPYIMKILRIALFVSGVFAGYKLINYFLPGIIDKIKASLAALFGWGVSKIGEDRVARVGETIGNARDYVGTKFVNMKEAVRKILRMQKDPELAKLAESEEHVNLVAEAMPRMVLGAHHLVTAEKLNSEAKKANPYYAGETIMQRTRIPEALRAQNLEAPTYMAMGAKDNAAYNLRENKINKNVVMISYSHGVGTRKSVCGVFVKGRTLLLPFHFFDACEEGTVFIMTDLKGNTWYETFESAKCVKLHGVDACVYACGLRTPQFASLEVHFPRRSELNVYKTEATLNVPTQIALIVHLVEAKYHQEVSYTEEGIEYSNDYVFEYECATQRGDCGSLLLAENNGIRTKILGIHVAGVVGQNSGVSAVIFRDDLETAIEMLPVISKVVPTNIIPESQITGSIEKMKLRPQSGIECLGAVAPSREVRLPHKSEIEPSFIHGLVREAVTEPAVLTKNDPRNLSGESPMLKAISKYGKKTLPFNKKDLKYIVENLKSKMLKWNRHMEGRLLTDWEAVFGNETIEYLDRMNLSASAGYPWILEKPPFEKGKAWLFDINAEDGIASSNFRHRYKSRETLAQKGIRIHSLWTDCLKDERRAKKKIEEGKTRAFMIAPADFVMLCRKYLMAFCVNFYGNHTKSFSGVGMDPYSYDWTILARRLCGKSLKAFGGDFHGYDGILDPDLIWACCEIINSWYKENDKTWKPEDDLVRQVLFEEMIHTIHICLNSIYRTFQGNKSGNPITVILNTMCHLMYGQLAYLGIQRDALKCIKEKPELCELVEEPHEENEKVAFYLWKLIMEGFKVLNLQEYDKYISHIFYGDDGLFSVHKLLQPIFNLITVSNWLLKYGIEYTSESKDGELYGVKPLTECTFLKNGFRKEKGDHFWYANISQDTIYELTNWVKKSDDPLGQMRENLVSAARFAFFHGREFFESFTCAINAALASRGCETFAWSFEHHQEAFRLLCRV